MEYFYGNVKASNYLHVSPRKIALWRQCGLIQGVRSDHGWIYSQDELDHFMESWKGYSLRNKEEILTAKRMKNNGILPSVKSMSLS